MILTHLFASPDAQARAHYWLNLHGFEVDKRNLSRQGSPRLALCVAVADAPAAIALIDSAERANAEGYPGLADSLHQGADARAAAGRNSATPAKTLIHWEPTEKTPCDDPRVDAVRRHADGYHE